ncbi:MAG: NFYB/HAP3 family transcription factor subunit [Candidatus Nanohaloarchaeota archaeon QJJ-7]|nr:NFYB/HAP3 family transcription factor subunit [Candidatus Nanohaloarchaeota archaeon QJJ-7]
MEITTGEMKELLKEKGASDVEEEAAEELAEVLENYIGYITEEAIGQAREKEKDVIGKEDILEAEK